MGAEEFEVTAKGGSMRAAFDAARADALHWHGHGGYTGTIAEKGSYYDAGRTTATADQVLEAYRALAWGELTDEERDELAAARPTGADRAEWEAYSQKQRRMYDAAKERALAELDPALARLNWKRIIEVADDKWGDAVAVALGDDTYLFFGLASS